MAGKNNDSVILIGMPGAGKSTLGVLLAKALAKNFTDTDILIQNKIGCTLQHYLDQHGYQALRREEEWVLQHSDFSDSIIATGGSAIYSEKGMHVLSTFGTRVFLQISYDTVEERVHNAQSRGIACDPSMDLHHVYLERLPLYRKYADKSVVIDGLSVDEALEALLKSVTI